MVGREMRGCRWCQAACSAVVDDVALGTIMLAAKLSCIFLLDGVQDEATFFAELAKYEIVRSRTSVVVRGVS